MAWLTGRMYNSGTSGEWGEGNGRVWKTGVQNNVWHDVFITHSSAPTGEKGTTKLYVDGVFESETQLEIFESGLREGLEFGGGNTNRSDQGPLRGNVKYLRIWNTELSADQIMRFNASYHWDFTQSTTDNIKGVDLAPSATIDAEHGLVFNGSTTYDLPGVTLDYGGSNNEFTISFEFKYDSYAAHATLFEFGTAQSDNGLRIKGVSASPELFIRPQHVYGGASNHVVRTDANYTIVTGTYYKATLTSSNTPSTKLYINGNLVNSSTAGFESGPRSHIFMGGQSDMTSRNFTGSIRNITIWNRILSDSEIQDIGVFEPPLETWIPVIQQLNKTTFANASAVTSGSGSIDTTLYSMGSSAFNSGGYNSSGKYLFRLVYGNDVNSPAYDFQWYQTTNPWEVNTSQVGAIEYPVGFSAPPSSDGRSFVGLGISSSSSRTLLDGTADGSWWYAVGIINHDLGNPGPNKTWYNNLNWYVWG